MADIKVSGKIYRGITVIRVKDTSDNLVDYILQEAGNRVTDEYGNYVTDEHGNFVTID